MSGKAATPKVIIKGKGEIQKSPMGRYIWEVLAVAQPPPENRQRLKSRIGELLWTHLQGEFNAEQRRAYIHSLMEELEIDRRDEAAKMNLIEATLKVCKEFELRESTWQLTQKSTK